MGDLENNCERCGGSGMVTLPSDMEFKRAFCPECRNGKVPSEAGKELINFILKYQHTEHWERR